jgi:membrane carboxypeptidase/penicillin-binding protein
VALPFWADFMKRVAAVFPAREFAIPPTVEGESLCSVSHLRPVEGCPVYTEYFKEGDDRPSQLCPIHRGSLKQAVVRTADKLFRGLGRAVAGLFRR